MRKKIFVTGGAGYIGSHTVIELLQQGHEVLVYDSFVNSSPEVLRRVGLITNKPLIVVTGDIRDKSALLSAIKSFCPDTIIHFAGLKAVNDSIHDPLLYYDVNVQGSLSLLRAMSEVDCNEIIFSSSATVYGQKAQPPYSETHGVAPSSPYGNSKLIFETILEDWIRANEARRAVILRYFNPVGSHSSGMIGDDHTGAPNNLMPLIVQVANKKRQYLNIYGADYDTKDGTGERDFIHISDLAAGHVKATEKIKELNRLQILNLGTGKSTTVIELVRTFEQTSSIFIPLRKVGRRAGDVPISFADTTLAFELLGFECKKTLSDMCVDTWNWARRNPDGYN